MIRNKIIFAIVIFLYISLLIPGLVVSYIGESSGIVISSKILSGQQFPLGIQDFIYPGNITIITYYDLNSFTKSTLVTSGSLQFSQGELIKIKDTTLSMSVDSREFSPIIDQAFNRLLIGIPEKVGNVGTIINIIPTLLLKSIVISFSFFFLYLGGFLIMMGMSYYYKRSLTLWTIPGMISCYSFQSFLASIIADINKAGFDSSQRIFGYFFIIIIPITILMSRYEETQQGKDKIINLYEKNKRIMQSIWNDFKKFLGIHPR